jgi:hypothetical protein
MRYGVCFFRRMGVALIGHVPCYSPLTLLHLEGDQAEVADQGDGLDQALLDDEFYVQQRDPSVYGAIWDQADLSPEPAMPLTNQPTSQKKS